MFYDKQATLLNRTSESDGMGGWVAAEHPTELKEILVAQAPISTELALKGYGLDTQTSLKLYTEDTLPEDGDYYIHFNEKDYRVLQHANYGAEQVLLLEMM